MATIIPHWLDKQAGLMPDKVAIELVSGECLTYKQLQIKSRRFARKLAHLAVGPRKRVAILSVNSIDMIIGIHALSYLGAIAVMINTKLTNQEISYQLEAANAVLLIQSEDLATSKQVGVVDSYTFGDIHNLPEKEVSLAEEIHLNHPFTMMFTSGTTGKPKAVLHTYGNHWWSAIGSALNLGLYKEDKWLLTLPIFHVGGFSILMRGTIYGMSVFLMEKYNADVLFKTLKEKQITIASIVTVMLRDILALLKEEHMPKNVRCLLLGGGSVPKSLLEQVKENNLPLFQSYGMTETSSQIVTLSEADSLRKIGSSGKPLFPAALQILHPDYDGIGEIAVKGPMVFHGYDQNPIATATAFEDGWFRTGDLGYLDKEGFLFVVERRTDLIISGGENIYPSEVEAVFLGLKNVIEAAVVGRPDEKWGQIPVLFVVCSDGSNDKDTLLSVAKKYLASYKVPKEVYFKTALPRTASNKVIRHKLLEDLPKN